MASKELLLTINYSFTYEVAVNTDVDLEIIKDYPKTKDKLPSGLLRVIEPSEVGADFIVSSFKGELVDKYIEILEVVDVDKELGL